MVRRRLRTLLLPAVLLPAALLLRLLRLLRLLLRLLLPRSGAVVHHQRRKLGVQVRGEPIGGAQRGQ